MRLRGRLLALGMLAATLAGCTKGEVYDMPVSKVESRLRNLTLPAEMGFGANGSDATIESVSDTLVTWRISDGGATLGWLDAELEAVDLERTRVAIDFRLADVAGTGQANQQKFLAAVGRVALTEAIDAELEDRRVNKRKIQAQVLAYALSHREEIASWDDSGAISDRMRDQEVSAAAARDPAFGVAMRELETEEKMKAASAPSLDLDPKKY